MNGMASAVPASITIAIVKVKCFVCVIIRNSKKAGLAVLPFTIILQLTITSAYDQAVLLLPGLFVQNDFQMDSLCPESCAMDRKTALAVFLSFTGGQRLEGKFFLPDALPERLRMGAHPGMGTISSRIISHNFTSSPL
ncbi:hypothetical protein [Lucifera butyrica]|uniref:hypothetical protein n=1 Tax=Lucifera butyrica TaxID=1351585 RepID=UPI00140231FF|nr:hypothetical protein [Lucifera butyrica]